MSDITKCYGNMRDSFPLSVEIGVEKDYECPHKDKCQRYTAKPNDFQYYFVGLPINQETNECEYFTPIEK